MSDAHDSHTGPIKTPKQLLWVSFYAFVAPVLLIIGLVFFVAKGDLPSTSTMDPELAIAMRIQPVGSVALRDGNRALQPGDAVYRAQCAACHDAGLVGAPMFGSVGDWTARISQGLELLVQHTLEGKGNMGAQGGGAFSDIEIARAVVFLANAGGASFEEPAAPEAAE
jgi:cytochrome c5